MSNRGFSLFEILLVITLMGFVYMVATPDSGIGDRRDVADRIGRLRMDFKSAFDQALLSGKTLRFVFRLDKNEYWLEEALTPEGVQVLLGGEESGQDLSPEEDKERIQNFEEEFERFTEVLGDPVTKENGDEIPITSPVLKAKAQLRGPSWQEVDNLEWQGRRSLGNSLMISWLKAEHHQKPYVIEEPGQDEVWAMIYVAPGYIEPAHFVVSYQAGGGRPDPDKTPYTMITHPREGYLEVKAGQELPQ